MLRSQGKYFTVEERQRIVVLLKQTDLSIADIAARMRCSRSAVASLNRRFQVREYDGRRSHWVVACEREASSR